MIKKLFYSIYLISSCWALNYEPDGHIHILEVNPSEHQIIAVNATGREHLIDLVGRFYAAAGVNGGYYNDDGSPQGLLVVNGEKLGDPVKLRGSVCWSSGESPLFKQIGPQMKLPEHQYMIGGAPLLIKNNEVILDYSSENTLESFLTTALPRTAVGVRDDGTWIFVTVESPGMNMIDLAYFMYGLDCVDAVNLCGGNSARMVIDSLNVRKGYDKPIGNAILILPKSAQ
ncbi:MAG: phosphodiester glycosidase family protein [Simkaniaceae bacterium]|nr:phosphodiester glycosidase family protein [Simkaniaceae bacterium]